MICNFLKCWFLSSIRVSNKPCFYCRNCRVNNNFSRSFLHFLFSLNTSFVTSSRVCGGKFSGTFFSFFVWPTVINNETFILIIFSFINSVFFLTCCDNLFSITFDEKIFYVIVEKFLLLKGILSIDTVMNLTKNIILEDFCMGLFWWKIIKLFCRKFHVSHRRLMILSVESLKMEGLLLDWVIMRKFLFDKLDLITFNLFV